MEGSVAVAVTRPRWPQPWRVTYHVLLRRPYRVAGATASTVRQAIVKHSIVFHFCLFAFTFDFCIPKHCKLPSDPQSCRRGSIFGTGTTWRDGLNGNFFSSFFLGSLSAQFGWPISPQQFSELFFLHERISDSQRGHLDESSPFKNRLKGLLFFCSWSETPKLSFMQLLQASSCTSFPGTQTPKGKKWIGCWCSL